MQINTLYTDAVILLQQLIAIPSFSRHEDATAAAIAEFLQIRGIRAHRLNNNVWAISKNFDATKPTILLNSHHDTVRPNLQYNRDPFLPQIEEGKLYGLGSNDAGGCLVSLLSAFLYFYQNPQPFNLVFAATAEEEISGSNGIELLLKSSEFTDSLNGVLPGCAIVGEPTQMQLAVAEKGLLVLDCQAEGKAGHAARNEGENAIYKAMKDIEWFSRYKFAEVSEWLGEIKMSVTSITTENKAHNIVPAHCNYTVDVRITDAYTHEQVLSTIKKNVLSNVQPRSMRLRSSAIAVQHPLVQAGLAIGKNCYGSPTSSDKALMPFDALKCGPGDSARSHTADEFIYLNQIEEGITDYIRILQNIQW